MSEICKLTEGTIGSFSSVRLENQLIQAEILPTLGAKIWNLFNLADQRQWIWHNPTLELKAVEAGASYDDNWAGGWEELFPNDAAGEFRGLNLPDHGEWWSQPWQWEVIRDTPLGVEIRLWRKGSATCTSFAKRISLAADSPRLLVSYRIENLSTESLYFLFKEHLAVNCRAGDVLELPGGRGRPVDRDCSTLIGGSDEFDWPHATNKRGEVIDLSMMPPAEERHREFVYLSDSPAGWCGVRDPNTGAAIRLHFPRRILPYTWLFMTFGGWRDLYTVVLEPCTNMPKDLSTALARGQCAMLGPGQIMECEVYAELSPGIKGD